MKISSSPLVFLATALVSRATAFAPNHNGISSSIISLAATQKEDTTFFGDFVNEEEMLAKSTFTIPPEKLMERAKEVLSPSIGLGTKDGGECLAEDFEFVAAVVGPIPREEYLNALGTFNLEDAFDITTNHYGLSVDPLQPNRVWFLNRVTGIHKGTCLSPIVLFSMILGEHCVPGFFVLQTVFTNQRYAF